ncbi:MAG: glycosyl hydrolase 108 family protein [Paludibacter sp.]|nr:glycosyl hydrolase 108 family protein [Paludibacter sp.]
MANFNISLHKTLIHEGGYSNDPDDRGGETYKGISLNAHKNWKGWDIIHKYKIKPGFPKNLEADIELQKEIEYLYRVNYWNPINGNSIMTQSIANSIFDFGVNAGVKTSIRMVQSVLGTEVDGIFGTKTLVKLNSTEPKYFHAAFTVKKITYYISIIKKRPVNKKFLYGWIIRTLQFQ